MIRRPSQRNLKLVIELLSIRVFFVLGQKFAMMEEKVVLASIVHRFNITSTQVTDDIRKSPELILKSMEGIMVKLETRRH
jgi:hypothetical protein